jgi:hypothetical protein
VWIDAKLWTVRAVVVACDVDTGGRRWAAEDSLQGCLDEGQGGPYGGDKLR